MAQGPIEPGKVGFLVRRFTADFPCDLSANVQQGTLIYWNPSDDTASPAGTASLAGDVTNGFVIGTASFPIDAHKEVPLGIHGIPLCATTDSTTIRVVSLDGVATVKGTFTTTPAPTTAS
jgi:hypothetical protein